MKTREFFARLIFVVELIAVGSSTLRFPRSTDSVFCPPGFQNNHPLIVVSLDGFSADYLEKQETPTIEALSKHGVKAPFIKPSYPTITFPNHYTIVTGLLPGAHGIVANKFFDPEFNATFRVGRDTFLQKRFWGGEPIWQTAEKQGKIAATYFWPGSEAEGMNPSYWFPYNESHPFKERVDTVLQWLDLPPAKRPHLINFYFHEPDRQGHDHGPDSMQVRKALRKVDDTLRYFLEGLQTRNLLGCVNLIVFADHGMAPAGRERLIYLQNYIPSINRETSFWDGVFPRFERLDKSVDKTQAMMEKLSCKRKQMRVYHKHHMPLRWHLGNQRRVEDVVLDLDAGFQIDFDGSYKPDEGDHGYDNLFHLMNALFLAHGPAFKSGVEVESFQNIEIYNLMCVLLGVSPAPNNGTWGSLHHLLKNPPPVNEFIHNKSPPIARVPSFGPFRDEDEDSDEKDDLEDASFLHALRNAEPKTNELLKTHMPWGIPQVKNTHVKLLIHEDHITGYSEDLGLPIWVAFHLEKPEGSTCSSWIEDVRITSTKVSKLETNDFADKSLMWKPLFQPDFSEGNGMEQLPFLSTNAVPLRKQLRRRWKQLTRLLRHWSETYEGGVNVVIGTIFDYDYDSFADDLFPRNRDEDEPLVPTHLFALVTRCLSGNGVHCPDDWLDVNAFIFPQDLSVSNCMDFKSFAREFSAKVDDVEKAAGIQFFPLLNYADRTRLKIRIHSNLWGLEHWKNRIRSDAYGLKKR